MPTLTLARSTALCLAALAVLISVPVAFGAKLVGGARYSGQATGGGEVTLRLSGTGRRVARMRIHYMLRCDNGRVEKSYTDILNARIRDGGKFSSRGTYTGTRDQSLNKFTVHGVLSRRSAKGTFSLNYEGGADAKGASVTCKTGALRWHASRGG